MADELIALATSCLQADAAARLADPPCLGLAVLLPACFALESGFHGIEAVPINPVLALAICYR